MKSDNRNKKKEERLQRTLIERAAAADYHTTVTSLTVFTRVNLKHDTASLPWMM